ncbi:MAG: 50S ribosomal protein L11 methyltransferase [Planctomycetes bacterium]|nr:50S ribosomal protein L11 methyltransferase [Planctomycetota bacterium]MCC7397041.1 50S ribosomal protein L11 methyltransferase [Planctomycetota bacterium]
MSGAVVRAFVLHGPEAAVALDWLHVHADLAGVEELDHAFVVYTTAPLPALPFAAVEVHEHAVDPALLRLTGLEHDRPIRVADDLLVRPPWVPAPADFRGLDLVVPRGNAFGSGEHGSTRAALRCLHRWWGGIEAPPASCLDVGTGSGILALYAKARGTQGIAACDIDAPSVAAARELLPGARIVVGGPEQLPAADLVLANMTGSELTAVMPLMLARWTRRAALVLSGMRQAEVGPVTALVPEPPAWFETVDEFTAACFPGAAGWPPTRRGQGAVR